MDEQDKKLKRFPVRLPRYVLDGVQSVADAENRSVNQQIVHWLIRCLREYQAEQENELAKHRAFDED